MLGNLHLWTPKVKYGRDCPALGSVPFSGCHSWGPPQSARLWPVRLAQLHCRGYWPQYVSLSQYPGYPILWRLALERYEWLSFIGFRGSTFWNTQPRIAACHTMDIHPAWHSMAPAKLRRDRRTASQWYVSWVAADIFGWSAQFILVPVWDFDILDIPKKQKHEKHIHTFPNIFPLEILSWFYRFSWYRSKWCFDLPSTAQDQSDKHLFVHLNCLNGLDRRVHLQLKVGSEKWGILNFWRFFLGNMFENNDKPR